MCVFHSCIWVVTRSHFVLGWASTSRPVCSRHWSSSSVYVGLVCFIYVIVHCILVPVIPLLWLQSGGACCITTQYTVMFKLLPNFVISCHNYFFCVQDINHLKMKQKTVCWVLFSVFVSNFQGVCSFFFPCCLSSHAVCHHLFWAGSLLASQFLYQSPTLRI